MDNWMYAPVNGTANGAAAGQRDLSGTRSSLDGSLADSSLLQAAAYQDSTAADASPARTPGASATSKLGDATDKLPHVLNVSDESCVVTK